MLKRISGVSNLMQFSKKASTVFPNGGSVTFDAATGFIKPLVATDPSVLGVIQQAIAATDGDYAQNSPVLVDQSNNQEVWEADVANGGSTAFSATDVGQFFKMGGTSDVIDCNSRSSTAGAGFVAQGLVYICVGFIKATTTTSDSSTGSGKGLFKIMSQSQTRPAST